MRPVRPKMTSIEGISRFEAEDACHVLGFKTMRLPDGRNHACIAEDRAVAILYWLDSAGRVDGTPVSVLARRIAQHPDALRAYHAAVALTSPREAPAMAELILLPLLKLSQ